MKRKILIVGGVVSLGVIVLIYIYLASQRKVQGGINYDLTPAGEIFNITGDTGATDSQGNRIPVDSRIEPAASLIAQQMDAFYKSENTMTEIRQRIGFGSNLFKGISEAAIQRIKNIFSTKFAINPNSLMSYPLWDIEESPFLGLQLKQKGQASLATFRAGSNQLRNWATVPQWGIDFSQIGIDATSPTGFADIRKFFENAAAEIYRLDSQVRYEAVKYLQNQGWKFSDYGDVR